MEWMQCASGERGGLVDSRTRLAIGGITTVVASVAVVCAVAITTSVALADAPGASIGAARVVVPSTGSAASAGAEAAAAPAPETAVPDPSPVAEVVPAPDPVIVDLPVDGPVTPPLAPASPASAEAAIAAADASGSWAAVRAWAAGQGWSTARIDAWISQLEESRGGGRDPFPAHRDDDRELGQQSWDAPKGQRSERSERRTLSPNDLERTDVAPAEPPQQDARPAAPETIQEQPATTVAPGNRPAHAGTNTENRSEKPGLGAKKDRSRDSPDRRD